MRKFTLRILLVVSAVALLQCKKESTLPKTFDIDNETVQATFIEAYRLQIKVLENPQIKETYQNAPEKDKVINLAAALLKNSDYLELARLHQELEISYNLSKFNETEKAKVTNKIVALAKKQGIRYKDAEIPNTMEISTGKLSSIKVSGTLAPPSENALSMYLNRCQEQYNRDQATLGSNLTLLGVTCATFFATPAGAVCWAGFGAYYYTSMQGIHNDYCDCVQEIGRICVN